MPSASIMLAPIPSNRLGPIRSASGFGPISGGLNLPPPGSLGISLPPSALAFLIKSLNLSMSPEGGLPLSAPGCLAFSGVSAICLMQSSLSSYPADRQKGLLDLFPVQFLQFRENYLPCREDVFFIASRAASLMAIPDPLPSGGISPARKSGSAHANWFSSSAHLLLSDSAV
jgi:hypothetical protein